MLAAQRSMLAVKRQVDAATVACDAPELAPVVLRDMVAEGRTSEGELLAVLGQIPPIALGRKVYRVVCAGRFGYTLAGPRGGTSHLVQNVKNPTMWWHGDTRAWYRSDDGITFARAS